MHGIVQDYIKFIIFHKKNIKVIIKGGENTQMLACVRAESNLARILKIGQVIKL